MNGVLKHAWPLLLLGLALVLSVAMNIRNYDWNISSVFHMDDVLHQSHPMPKDFVILKVPSYDGAQYYQIARNMPAIFNATRWHELTEKNPGSYAYQRFLLPLFAYVLALGSESALPFAFVLINIFSLLGASLLLMRSSKCSPLSALALGLCPAAMVAMHFTLAEPLTILLITASLLRMEQLKKIDWLTVLLLSLVVLAREVNILFVGFLIGYSILKRQPLDALKLLIPALCFLALHSLIFAIFGNIPFFLSAAAHQFPGKAAFDVLIGSRGYNQYTLSSVALLLGFVIPNLLWTGRDIWKTKSLKLFTSGAFAFLCLMLIMPDYIWGSITSIGRVITPVYPLTILALAKRGTTVSNILTLSILLLGIGTSIGLALQVHPFGIA